MCSSQQRNLYLFLLLLLFILTTCATGPKRGDFELGMNGFRGYTWGTTVEDIGDPLEFQGVDEARNIEWFTRKDDPLQIGKANLESITYVFRDSRFAAVSIVAKGLSNYETLRGELEQGLGKTQAARDDDFSWDLPHTSVLFNYNKKTDVAMLVIRAKEN